MCAYSMIVDHYADKWEPLLFRPHEPLYPDPLAPVPAPPAITPAEVEEFRQLLARAREYDRTHNQPDCETEAKRERIKKLADELGLQIDFV